MEFFYEKIDLEIGYSFIKRSDGACIPLDMANTDYQAYLKWVEETNG